jgi:hypothetical protein
MNYDQGAWPAAMLSSDEVAMGSPVSMRERVSADLNISRRILENQV